MNIQINEAALAAVVNEPNGPVAIELVLQASVFAQDAKEAISIPRPYGQGRHLGNPFLRTGDLMRSINVESPKVEDGNSGPSLVSYVSFSSNIGGRHYQTNYAQLLRDGGVNQHGQYGPFRFNSAAKVAQLTYEDI